MPQVRNVISLLGHPPVFNEDDKAAEEILPGHLVGFNGSGDLVKNTANAANVARAFVLEREEMGSGIDVPYAVGDQVKVGSFHAGQRVYAFLASGQNVLKGDYLTGDAAGCLTKTGVSATIRIARALEAVNSVSPTQRIRAEIV